MTATTPTPAASRHGWPASGQLVLLSGVAIASIAAVAGFRSVLVDWSFLPAATVGGIGASFVILVAWWRRLLIGESIVLSVVAFVAVGTIATQGLPTPDAFRALFDGLTTGWADLLSQTPPLDATGEIRILPFTLAWIGSTVGGELLRRTTAPVLPTIGPLIALAVSVLVTAEDRSVGLAQGAIIALVALAIGFVQFRRVSAGSVHDVTATDEPPDLGHSSADDRRTRRRVGRAGAVLVVVAVVAPLLGPRLPFASANERFDLRDRNVPPWDPLLIPSPLVQLKSSLKDDVRDDVVFTVQADEPIDRFDLAVLGAYDGVVWTVGSSDETEPQIEFRPVGSRFPARPGELDIVTTERSATVTIQSLRGPWLPSAGWPTAITFTDDEPDTAEQLRMNLVTGTLAMPAGVTSGLTYVLDIDIEQRPSDAMLGELSVQERSEAVDDNVVIPGSIRNIAADILEGVDPGWEQLAALRNSFITDGFYDTSPESRPGHSYFRLAEFLDDRARLVGYEEQYAAAAATISELAKLPTRVVVGYLVPSSRYDAEGVAEVLSSDISAWIEVDFGTSGWISVDITPDRSREPIAEATGISIEDVAVPSPPPPPQIPPDPAVFADEEEPEEADEDEDKDDDEERVGSGFGVGAAIGLAAGAGGFLLVLLFGAIVWWKEHRRSRRRHTTDPATRIGWAWCEMLDRYSEAGFAAPHRGTPRETVRSLLIQHAAPGDVESKLHSMVTVIERAAYHHESPAPEVGDVAWTYYDGVVDALQRERTALQRLKMKADPRSVVGRRSNGREWHRRAAQ